MQSDDTRGGGGGGGGQKQNQQMQMQQQQAGLLSAAFERENEKNNAIQGKQTQQGGEEGMGGSGQHMQQQQQQQHMSQQIRHEQQSQHLLHHHQLHVHGGGQPQRGTGGTGGTGAGLGVVPTRIAWRYGGRQVFLCGSFTRWVDTLPMVPIEHHSAGSSAEPCLIFGIDINLPLGYHQFKFIVDGKWRHDDALPVVQDPLGNLNNWVHVPTQQQQQQLQQQHVDAGAGGGGGGAAAGAHLPLDAAGMLVHAMGATVGMQQHGSVGGGAGGGDVSMDWTSSPSALPPHLALETDRMITVKRIGDFFTTHTAYELIPESGKVIVLDADLTLKQAFHALYEQRISSAPLWDNVRKQIVGMISPSDFIVLQRLFSARGAGTAELDIERQTIRGLRESAMPEGFVRPLLSCEPSDSLSSCVMTLTQGAVSSIPVLHYDGAEDEEEEEEDEEAAVSAAAAAKKPRGAHVRSPAFGAPSSRTSAPESRGSGLPVILHLATLSDIFGMLVRYFHSSIASLPLLGHPIGALGIGTWATHSIEDGGRGGIHTIGLDTPLSTTLQLLINADVGALPVVDATGAVQEVYGRSDIIALALDSAYSTIDWETTSVSQALTHVHDAVARTTAAGKASGTLASRSALITKAETLRGVIERLSLSGVRRVVCVDSATRHVEGIITLRDVASFLLGMV